MLVNIIGWLFLIGSWVLPKHLSQDEAKQKVIKMVLAAFAAGIFVGSLLEMIESWFF